MIASDNVTTASPVGARLGAGPSDRAPLRSGPGSFAVEIDAAKPDRWDLIASDFADVSYDQTSAFADARWGGGRTSTLVVRENGRPAACARLVILRPPLLRTGLAYVKFGPLWRRSRHDADPQLLRRILAALVEEYCGRRGHMLAVLPRPSPEHNALEEEVLRDAGFRQRHASVDPTRYLVDVSLDRTAQMASLGQKWRYNLRKAMQAGLSVSLAGLEDGIGEFAEMHRVMVARKRFMDRDAVEARLDAMGSSLPPSLRPSIAFVRKDGRALAGAVVGRTGEVPVYLFGASRDQALELNAGYLLQWWIVNWLHEQGDRWYDLGGGAMEPRLEQFKRGLVGKAGRLLSMPGEYDFWTGVSGRISGDLVYRARDIQRLARALLNGR